MAKNEKRRFLGVGVIAAIGLLAFAILIAFAASGTGGGAAIDRNVEGSEGLAVTASTVATGINYQGMLTDSGGNPLDGTYTMTLSLYEVASGGTALDTDTHSVEVTDGLFNTNIDFAQRYFDGRALWLGIKVGADAEMTPRQELRPVPYALSLRPGAVISGSDQGGPALEVKNTCSAGSSDGVRVSTTGRHSYGVYAKTTGLNSDGVHARTYDRDSDGVHAETTGKNSHGFYAYTTGKNSEGFYARTTGKDSPAVYGYSEQDVGVYGKGKEGGYFTTRLPGSLRNPLAGVNVSTARIYNPGVRIETTGNYSDGVYAKTTGLNSDGVHAHTTGNYSEGFYAKTTGYKSRGVLAETYGDHSKGVYAYTTGNYSEGVFAETYGDHSDGVRAFSAKSYGVHATGVKAGIYAEGIKYAADLQGKVIIRDYGSGNPVMELGAGLDYAEGFDVSGKKEIGPGSVLIIDPDNPGKLTISDKPYDTKVAGIVTGAKGQGSGVRLGSDQFDYDVALAGRVYCNVDATYGSIEPGDLLTTSPTPGYAMKATDYERAQGAILGKAMEILEKGEKGQILVLVSLQ